MPNVTATPRTESNGDIDTYFIGVVGSTAATYTYPTNQDVLKFINRSVSSTMTLTVNGTNYTVPQNSSLVIYASFTSFTVVAQLDSQAFDATATATNSNDIQLSGSNVKLLNAVSAVGAGTPQAVGTFKNYIFEVWGTATSFDIQIQVVGPSSTARTINKVWDELNNAYLTSSDITTAGIYSVSVPAFTNIQGNVLSVAGGNVNVSGGLMQ
jgi:hypothetical protein